MKLGLRGKLGIMMVCLYLASVGGLFISFVYYSSTVQHGDELENDQNALSEWIIAVVQEASTFLYDETAFKSYLTRQAEKDGLVVILMDNEGNETWRTGRTGKGLRVIVHNTILDNSQVVYRIKAESYIPYQKLFYGVGKRFPVGMGIFFLFITLSLSIFLNILVVRPLMALVRRMNQFASTGARTEENRSCQRDEIKLLETSFEDMVERIKNLTREQQDMLSAILHDINTPLTTILGYTERLVSGRILDEDKRQQAYRIINRKTQDIADISKQLADIADVVERGWMNDVQVVDAYMLFNELFAPYQEEWSGTDCKVSLRNVLSPGVKVSANIPSLRRVIANIMENTLRYGCSPLEIEADVSREGDFIVLRIEDNGPGVPEESLPFIFKRFYQVDSSRSDSRTSHGLGLYICREIIYAHGGEIKAYLPPGGGLGISLKLSVYLT